MNNSIKNVVILVIYLTVVSGVSIAKNVNIDGLFTDSRSNRVSIQNKKMIVTVQAYEFYGQPSTVYAFTYKVSRVNEKQIKLKLLKSKIIGGPKKMKGSVRLWPKARNPGYSGYYSLKLNDNGNIEFINTDLSKTIRLKKKTT